MFNITESIGAKWAPVLDAEGVAPIRDAHKRAVVTKLLENQEQEMRKERQALFEDGVPANNIGAGSDSNGIAKFDPILISLVRRAMPQLLAYDVCGVQPMSGPTGLIFAMRSNFGTDRNMATRTEAFINGGNSAFSGTGADSGTNPAALNDATPGTYTRGTGMATASAEALGTDGGGSFGEMNFTIEKTTVTAQSRALKAEYTIELAQDLKAVHGLDAEGELSNILSHEIMFELNREVIRTIYTVAKPGSLTTTTPGTFDLDVDSNGRWSVERFKGLVFQIERDANVIAQDTRRGKGNFIICSADVASALAMAGMLDTGRALQGGDALQVDDTGNTFAGVLNGKYKVYIDPYSANLGAAEQFYVVGYKGQSAYDAGIFYAPYIPLQMMRAVDPDSFQPKIAFKTRYGMIANPFVTGTDGRTPDASAFTPNRNQYFRRSRVLNLL
jgi:hypothetical protein